MLPLFYISQITCRPACLPDLPIRVLIHHKTRARTRPISPVSQTTRARTRPNSPVHRTTQARTPPADPVATQVKIRQEILARTRPISPVTSRARTPPTDPVAIHQEIHQEILARTPPTDPVAIHQEIRQEILARTPPTDPVAIHREIRQEILARTRPISPVHRTTQAQARPISPVCRTSQPSLRLRQALPSIRVPPQAQVMILLSCRALRPVLVRSLLFHQGELSTKIVSFLFCTLLFVCLDAIRLICCSMSSADIGFGFPSQRLREIRSPLFASQVTEVILFLLLLSLKICTLIMFRSSNNSPLIFFVTIDGVFSSPKSSNPSSEPSASPTGGLYYPDWENGEQICVNDGADPEYSELY